MSEILSYRLALRLTAMATFAACAGLASPGCTSSFPRVGETGRLIVRLQGSSTGTPDARLPLSFTKPSKVTFDIEALRGDGTRDTRFDRYVRVTSKPGSVLEVSGPGARNRSVKLEGGVATGLEATLLAAYGDTRLWAEDEGYTPVDPGRTPAPKCSDGLDNDGDGIVDFPLDAGCAFANDDTEEGGSLATGTSEAMYFVRPRIADVRGIDSAGAATPFKSEQVSVDTGWRPETRDFEFNTVVTRISSNGFYSTDLGDTRGATSIFAFTFSSPTRLRVCDRIKSFTGTATEFFGMTQLASPTWTVEFWNPNKRPCLVPEPYVFKVSELSNTSVLFSREAALVRLVADTFVTTDANNVETKHEVSLQVGAHFGSKNVPLVTDSNGTSYQPTDDATNCDFDRNGKLDFSPGAAEGACSARCTADVECTEYSNFLAQSNFMIKATDVQTTGTRAPTTQSAKIQANGSSSPRFDAPLLRGKPIKAFTGALEYFSGGTQFTIEARCDDDIIVDLAQSPLPSDRACVRPRTELDNNEASQ